MPPLQARALRQAVQVPYVQRLADLFAVSCSGLCAIHCLATPALVILLPVLGASILGDEAFHLALLWFILPASFVAVTLGCWRHKDRHVALLCGLGLVVIVVAAGVGHDLLGETGEKALTLAGSLVLIAGHVRNYRLCRSGVHAVEGGTCSASHRP